MVWSASSPRSANNSSTSRSESEYRRYQRTAQRITSGAVCRHLNIAGRVAFFTIFADYQPFSQSCNTSLWTMLSDFEANFPQYSRRFSVEKVSRDTESSNPPCSSGQSAVFRCLSG